MDQRLTIFTIVTNVYSKNIMQHFNFFYPLYILRFLTIPGCYGLKAKAGVGDPARLQA